VCVEGVRLQLVTRLLGLCTHQDDSTDEACASEDSDGQFLRLVSCAVCVRVEHESKELVIRSDKQYKCTRHCSLILLWCTSYALSTAARADPLGDALCA